MGKKTLDIKPFVQVEPMVYAYYTPGVAYHDGWVKIGYTDKQTVEERIKQQTHTAGIKPKLLWKEIARYTDNSGKSFKDTDFHAFLKIKGVQREAGTEWFKTDKLESLDYFVEFASGGTLSSELSYTLRPEQEDAIKMTADCFRAGGAEFLWNAKPRFGKTLAAYDLICSMGSGKVLIVTNRPSIANSWLDDFRKFIEWQGKFSFVSDSPALKGEPDVISRDEFISHLDEGKGMIAFESLQNLKQSIYFGGDMDKLQWIAKEYKDNQSNIHYGLTFDLLIVDEAHDGVETMRTEKVFDNISRKHTLYLSGTPFKQLASNRFSAGQIYNWSYADEQERKENWNEERGSNPYEVCPQLVMYTYRLSDMIQKRIGHADFDGKESSDYAFDLNEFFSAEKGKFIHEADVKRFLHALVTQEKYPFSTPELRKELSHTLWYMERIDSVEAMEKLLNDDQIFSGYKIVKVVGDGSSNEDEDESAKSNFDRVKNGIENNDKTITLTVGQLTLGVTVPEWSGILMLRNLTSPASYMQAAFRVQNPYMFTTKDGATYQKERAYVFDFDPARTLTIFDDFANNLNADTAGGKGTGDKRKDNIKRLLNFFPVLGEDNEGRMMKLDAAQVLSIPRNLKSQEVVRSGFMCNYLFNIGNVFNAPTQFHNIVEKLPYAHEETRKKKDLSGMDDVHVDENGEVYIPEEIVIGQAQHYFAGKQYENIKPIQDAVEDVLYEDSSAGVKNALKQAAESVKEIVNQCTLPAVEDYVRMGVTKKAKKNIRKQIDSEIDNALGSLAYSYEQEENIAKAELDRRRKEARTEPEVKQAEDDFAARIKELKNAISQAAEELVQKEVEHRPVEVVERLEKDKAESAKQAEEEEIRSRLRGFSRTIPSFIMAYGDDGLTLANFDDYVDAKVFHEVTGITEEEFRQLRDGYDLTDENGDVKHYSGLFDETVFNDSIKEFLGKKKELANYFDESHSEDIFDYIPPQKTNQIFTPKRIVKMMADKLEEENPGCFDNADATFANLYMKSGLYIAEIVKRLYNSEALKRAIPDNDERIRHILRKQVYGMAPTRIIYLIATNFILGFDESLKDEDCNFVECDAAAAAQAGTLPKMVNQYFG